MLMLLDQAKPFVADADEAAIAQTAADSLAAVVRAGQGVQLVVREHAEIVVPLSARAVMLIHDLLEAMANRTPVSIVPHGAELSTQQAADYLNVSRPYLVGVIDRNEIPHRVVGRHRRIRFADLLAYEERSALARKKALTEMADEARRLNLE